MFDKSYVTEKGLQTIATALEGGKKVEFSYIKIGNGIYSEDDGKPQNIRVMTELKSEVENLSYGFADKEYIGNNKWRLRASIDNETFTESKVVTEIGIYATVEGVGTCLYSVAVTDMPEIVPAYNGKYKYTIVNEFFITLSNEIEVTIKANQGVYALADSMAELRVQVDELVDNKVDKVTGKGLSTNDFTTILKNKLENITSDVNKPVSTAQRAAIDEAYAQATGYTDQAIADLIGGAPSTRNTLKEISDAMDKHQDVVQAMHEAIGSKANEAEFESHRINSNIHVTTTEKQQIQAHQNFMQAFMNLFPSYSDEKTISLQLGGGFDAYCKATIYTAQEDCLIMLHGFVQFLTPPEGATIAANLLANNSRTIFATTLKGASTGTNAPISISMRLKEGDSIGAQMLCTGLSAEKGTIVNIHYFLKALPTGLVKSEMT